MILDFSIITIVMIIGFFFIAVGVFLKLLSRNGESYTTDVAAKWICLMGTFILAYGILNGAIALLIN